MLIAVLERILLNCLWNQSSSPRHLRTLQVGEAAADLIHAGAVDDQADDWCAYRSPYCRPQPSFMDLRVVRELHASATFSANRLRGGQQVGFHQFWGPAFGPSGPLFRGSPSRKLRRVNEIIDGYEPGGRRFESCRARDQPSVGRHALRSVGKRRDSLRSSRAVPSPVSPERSRRAGSGSD